MLGRVLALLDAEGILGAGMEPLGQGFQYSSRGKSLITIMTYLSLEEYKHKARAWSTKLEPSVSASYIRYIDFMCLYVVLTCSTQLKPLMHPEKH